MTAQAGKQQPQSSSCTTAHHQHSFSSSSSSVTAPAKQTFAAAAIGAKKNSKKIRASSSSSLSISIGGGGGAEGLPLTLSSSASSSSSSSIGGDDGSAVGLGSPSAAAMEKAQNGAAPMAIVPAGGVAGLISPQTICSQRALSIPVTSSSTSNGKNHTTTTLVDLDDYGGDDDAAAAATRGRNDSELPLNSHNGTTVSHQRRPARGGGRTTTTNTTTNTTTAKDELEDQPLQQSSCKNSYTYLRTTPAPMRSAAWAESPATAFQVRSADYLRSGDKITSASAVFDLLTVDLVLAPTVLYSGLCAQPNERIQLALAQERRTGVQQLPPFIFAVNLCLPAGSYAPAAGPDACYHCVGYFGVDDKALLTNTSTPEGRLMKRFFFGNDTSDDAFRDAAFKLIPRIVEGNFVVRKAVGSKPSLIGTKLKLHYVRTERYCEVLVDISSSPVAQRIVQLTLGYAKNLTVDMMFLFEGTDESTLPERILGGFRVCNVDFKHLDGQRMIE